MELQPAATAVPEAEPDAMFITELTLAELFVPELIELDAQDYVPAYVPTPKMALSLPVPSEDGLPMSTFWTFLQPPGSFVSTGPFQSSGSSFPTCST